MRRASVINAQITFQIALYALAGLTLTVIWAIASDGFYWPTWYWLAAVLAIGVQISVACALQVTDRPVRGLALYGAVLTVPAILTIPIWGLTGSGGFWPVYPLLGVAAGGSLYALLVFRDWLPGRERRQLTLRVEQLKRSRSDVLGVQDLTLRQIERDLHDGAQARLVALNLKLGQAQEKLQRHSSQATGEQSVDPRPPQLSAELEPLIASARAEAIAAIGELRELVRGIAPPLLTDRGLEAAVQALAQHSGTTAKLDLALDQRPPSVVETAAYFIVAESLTNAAKHAPGAQVTVRLRQQQGTLLIEVDDDGPGGADPDGNGLQGLHQRVAALDGRMQIISPPGGGTKVEVELPCE